VAVELAAVTESCPCIRCQFIPAVREASLAALAQGHQLDRLVAVITELGDDIEITVQSWTRLRHHQPLYAAFLSTFDGPEAGWIRYFAILEAGIVVGDCRVVETRGAQA
jgi:hypothetical protein